MLGTSSMAFACTFVRPKFKGNCTAALPPLSLSLFPLLALFSLPFWHSLYISLCVWLALGTNMQLGAGLNWLMA